MPTLPSLPRTVVLLTAELNLPEPSLRRLHQLFGTDPALTGLLLQQANAAAPAVEGRVASIASALLLVGTAPLRALVQQAAVGGATRTVPGLLLPQFWRYSLHTAKIARALARCVHVDASSAYTAGLLHALGEVVLHLTKPTVMLGLNATSSPLAHRRTVWEQRRLGYHYGHVSAMLARHWKLPQPLVDALQHQSAPFDNDTYEPLAGVLHLAVWRARASELGLSDREMAVSFPGEVGLALQLDIDMVLQQDGINWNPGARTSAGDFV